MNLYGAQRMAPMLAVIAQMEAALAREEPYTYLDLDLAFHDALVRAYSNTRLLEARLRVRDQTRRYLAFQVVRESMQSLRRNLAEHVAMAEAVRSGDPGLAERRVRTHIMSAGEAIAQSMNEVLATTDDAPSLAEADRTDSAGVASRQKGGERGARITRAS